MSAASTTQPSPSPAPVTAPGTTPATGPASARPSTTVAPTVGPTVSETHAPASAVTPTAVTSTPVGPATPAPASESKSAVSGAILVLVPGTGAVCVWSPGLNATNNSLVGSIALEQLAERSGWSIFTCANPPLPA